jgi:hypothetical protein
LSKAYLILYANPFPENFVFRLTETEAAANCDHLRELKLSPQLPAAFNEHVAIMAATVLNSPEAVAMGVLFVLMRNRPA